jgi:hypothetical protein
VIRPHRVEVTGKVTGEDPVDIGDQIVWVTSVTVTYDRDQQGQWTALATVGIDVAPLTEDYIGHVFKANLDGHPPWLDAFIDTARPTLGTETP